MDIEKLQALANRIKSFNEYSKGGKIHINPANRGKFNATKKRTGKTTEELTHSSNPLTRKRAIFAQNAAKWNHKHADGGLLDNDFSQGFLYPAPDSLITRQNIVETPVVDTVQAPEPIDYDEIKKRQYYIESKFNDKATNKYSGAQGAYQIMPITLKDYTQCTGETGDLNDYAFNERVRDFYMNRHLNSSWATKNNQSEYNRVAKALAAYNWGPGNLLKYLEKQKGSGADIYNDTSWISGLPGETRNYIKWILDGEDIGNRTTNAGYEKAKAERFASGGDLTRKKRSKEGGYETSDNKREEIASSYDPTGGFDPFSLLLNYAHGNRSRGDENEYWRAYLGLSNNVPKMNPAAKTSWDDAEESRKKNEGELPSDFYGTTPRMDQMVQAVADTLNMGRILRNYKGYKKLHPELPPKGIIESMYNQGKRVMDNPNTWQQVGEGRNKGQSLIYDRVDPYTNERAPLGMLGSYGMMWKPEEKRLHVQDTYDFPDYTISLSRIPRRPKEMKIRGLVSFDPERGSVLLRDGNVNYDKMAKTVAK